MYRRILVPLDGSKYAEQALPAAVGLARRTGAELRLLHALDFIAVPPLNPDDHWWQGTARSDAEAYLQDVAFKIVTAVKVNVTSLVVDATATSAILDQSRGFGADLIVMSTHGHGLFDRAWLGSVADSVVRESRIPILLIRARDKASETEPLFQHVLLPLDGSPLAERMVKPAARFARANRARVTLLQVVHPWVIATRPMAHALHAAEMRDVAVVNRAEDAEEYLSEIALGLDPRLKDVTADAIVAERSDAAEILKYAADHAVDVIALATHGRSGAKRLVLGSVADKIIRAADVPVLVLRPAD
jgi:nucleotide-binding universal stress UspA family protein